MALTSTSLALPGVIVLEPDVYGDDRGFFTEVWNQADFDDAIGESVRFVQDNHSRSTRGVLRGLHYQLSNPQGKLVRVAVGRVFDVAVDIRRESPTFGQWVGLELSAENHKQLWVPPEFAHGFLVLSAIADVLYKVTTYYDPVSDRSIQWSDPTIGIDWPIADTDVLLSDKDRGAKPLVDAEVFD